MKKCLCFRVTSEEIMFVLDPTFFRILTSWPAIMPLSTITFSTVIVLATFSFPFFNFSAIISRFNPCVLSTCPSRVL